MDVDDNGKPFGDGSHTLYAKILHRNNYCNRIKNTNSTRDFKTPSPKRSKIVAAQAGCQNWQPQSEEVSEEMKMFLKNAVLDTSVKNEEILDALLKTYPQQRAYFNSHASSPTIQEIKEEWPLILKEPYLYWHFEKLTAIPISVFGENFLKYANKIIKFGETKKYVTTRDSNDDENFLLRRALTVICKYFKEPISKILLQLAVSKILFYIQFCYI